MKKGLFLLVLFFLTSSVYASYHQKVKLCINVSNGADKKPWIGAFKSTDHYDHGFFTEYTNMGQQCKVHTYKHGPKTIQLMLAALGKVPTYALADSCKYYFNGIDWTNCSGLGGFDTEFCTPKFRTGYKNENWTFTVVPQKIPGNKAAYVINCAHSAGN